MPVGDVAVIKNAKDVEFHIKSVSKTRIQHIAKAYAWCFALSLMILKVWTFLPVGE